MHPLNDVDIFAGYAAAAEDLIPRFEALSTEVILAPVADLLPVGPCRVLDAGAGTGREAAWFASQGHEVTAVEPVYQLRQAGIDLHFSPNITWLDDRLPGLERVRASDEHFGLIILIGVWQHLQADVQPAALANLAGLLASPGRLIMSVRHGPGSPTRPCFPAEPERLTEWAEHAGLRLLKATCAPSIQQENRDAGVTWTWLCLERP